MEPLSKEQHELQTEQEWQQYMDNIEQKERELPSQDEYYLIRESDQRSRYFRN